MWPFLLRKREAKEDAAKKKSGTVDDGDGIRHLQELGVTDRLQEFVKTFTADTFKCFHLQDDPAADPANACAESNVRMDLTEWQERHATLILSKIKEIAQLRYVLCPRHLKDRQFWSIYFQLVKSYIAPYEMHAMQRARMKKKETEEASLYKAAIEVEMGETNRGAYSCDPEQNDLSSSMTIVELKR